MGSHANPLPLTEEAWSDALDMARLCAKKCVKRLHDQEDCASWCLLDLPRIWRHYDKSKSSFSTWLSTCFMNRARTFLRSSSFRRNVPRGMSLVSLNNDMDKRLESSDDLMSMEELMNPGWIRDRIEKKWLDAKSELDEVIRLARYLRLTDPEKLELDLMLSGDKGPEFNKSRDNSKQRMVHKLRAFAKENWGKSEKELAALAANRDKQRADPRDPSLWGKGTRTCDKCGKSFLVKNKYSSPRTYCWDCVPKRKKNMDIECDKCGKEFRTSVPTGQGHAWRTTCWDCKPRAKPLKRDRTCDKCGGTFVVGTSYHHKRTTCFDCAPPFSRKATPRRKFQDNECEKCGKPFSIHGFTSLGRKRCWECQPVTSSAMVVVKCQRCGNEFNRHMHLVGRSLCWDCKPSSSHARGGKKE